MSARPCGCDDAEGWICKQHGEAMEEARIERANRFKARLAAEAQMKDTTVAVVGRSGATFVFDDTADAQRFTQATMERATPSPAEQFRAEAVAVADAVQTRDDLLNRIAILEAEVAQLQRRNGQRQHDYLYLLEMERHDKEQFRNRIAAITATFYHADLTISSVQPILALACELNPELVERAR